MQYKLCPKCNKILQIKDFYKRKRGVRSGQYYEKCIFCMRIRGRKYYHQNHKRQLMLAKIRNKNILHRSMKYITLIKNKPCKDCGGYYPPWVMDFDHINSKHKTDNVASLRRFHNLKRVEEEISKCDLVCSNCHRNRSLKKTKSIYYDIINELEKEGFKFKWKMS